MSDSQVINAAGNSDCCPANATLADTPDGVDSNSQAYMDDNRSEIVALQECKQEHEDRITELENTNPLANLTFAGADDEVITFDPNTGAVVIDTPDDTKCYQVDPATGDFIEYIKDEDGTLTATGVVLNTGNQMGPSVTWDGTGTPPTLTAPFDMQFVLNPAGEKIGCVDANGYHPLATDSVQTLGDAGSNFVGGTATSPIIKQINKGCGTGVFDADNDSVRVHGDKHSATFRQLTFITPAEIIGGPYVHGSTGGRVFETTPAAANNPLSCNATCRTEQSLTRLPWGAGGGLASKDRIVTSIALGMIVNGTDLSSFFDNKQQYMEAAGVPTQIEAVSGMRTHHVLSGVASGGPVNVQMYANLNLVNIVDDNDTPLAGRTINPLASAGKITTWHFVLED